MYRHARQRIWKLERLLSKADNLLRAALAKQEETVPSLEHTLKTMRNHIRPHTTAVAAIVIWGEPKIDEPLICAWKRTLAYHGLDREEALKEMPARSIVSGFPLLGDDAKALWRPPPNELRGTENLYPLIVDDPDYRSPGGYWESDLVHAPESARFTEVLRTAPIWLLHFTWIYMDALALEFELPDLSAEPVWGIKGLEDATRWPLLPLGTIGAGGPPPKDLLSPEDRCFYDELQKRPKEEWSRFERRRMQQLISRLSVKDSVDES